MSDNYGGSGDKTLVAGALTIFRHFQLDLRSSQLAAMSWRRGQGGHDRTYRALDIDLNPAVLTYHARCAPVAPWRALRRRLAGQPAAPDGHASPHVDCTCGFYGHYDPEGDFYPNHSWGKVNEAIQGGARDLAIVRAVCEVSGTTVMGRLGVRAEKMRIKAIAVDFDKRMSLDRTIFDDADSRWRIARSLDAWLLGIQSEDVGSLGMQSEWGRHGTYADMLESMQRQEVAAARAAARAAGTLYGCKVYDSVEEMHRDHPKEDVSALGVEAAPRPESASGVSGAIQALQSLGPAGQAARQTLQEAVYAWMSASGSPGFQPGTTVAIRGPRGFRADFVIEDEAQAAALGVLGETVKERALRLKRERPAPPGTGIDRRRGKLR